MKSATPPRSAHGEWRQRSTWSLCQISSWFLLNLSPKSLGNWCEHWKSPCHTVCLFGTPHQPDTGTDNHNWIELHLQLHLMDQQFCWHIMWPRKTTVHVIFAVGRSSPKCNFLFFWRKLGLTPFGILLIWILLSSIAMVFQSEKTFICKNNWKTTFSAELERKRILQGEQGVSLATARWGFHQLRFSVLLTFCWTDWSHQFVVASVQEWNTFFHRQDLKKNFCTN